MENISVKALVRLVGINENTLRAWERRYGAVEPRRDEEGHRIYSRKDVERVRFLWALVKEGHSIGKIASLPNATLKKLLSRSLAPEANELPAQQASKEAFLSEMVRALGRFDLEKLNQILLRARFELSTKEIVLNVIRPLLVKVGELVHQGKLSITQEHLLSALLRDYLGNIQQSLAPYDFTSRAGAPGVMLTTREGDMHEFGILSASILSHLYRLRTYYLGPNMPVADLVDAVQTLKVDYLVLGITGLPANREPVTPVEFLQELDRELPRRISFCLGGHVDAEKLRLKRDRQLFLIRSFEELDRMFSALK